MKTLNISTVIMVLSILYFCGNSSMANPVDTNTAKIVAKNFMQKHDPTIKSTSMLRISDAAISNGLRNLYIISEASGKGFVVISADDCVMPVLAYSTTSAANREIPVNALDWFRGYDGEIAYCVANNMQASESTRDEWNRLKSSQSQVETTPLANEILVPLSQSAQSHAVVGPLLSTQWNQAPIYNNLCPYDYTHNDRTVVGCVATAMAQIMKYWNHPVRGTGSKSYYAQDQNQTISYGQISANFGNTTYDWANMPSELSANSSAAEINAVATLSFHCGVAVEMMYGVSSQGGSGAYVNGNYSPTAEYALKTYFGYKSTLASAYRDYYSDNQWDSILRHDLDAGLPLLHRGSGTGGGHAFVCDGYDAEGKFHYNWGWGGSYDGFFASNNLAPRGGGIGSNQSNTFNQYQAVVYGIEPTRSSLMIRPETVEVPSTGGNSVITVLASSDTAHWTATTNYPWINLSTNRGPGSSASTNITITAPANITGYNRSGEIAVIQHNDTIIVRVTQAYGFNSAAGQYGNKNTNYLTFFDSSSSIIMRPEMYGNFNIGDTVKSVYFTTYLHSSYPQYSDSIFTIKIYENPNYTNVMSQGNWDTVTNVLGSLVYTQTYYQPTQGYQLVNLTTPYVVNGNPFWVSITSEGQALVRYYTEPIGDSVLSVNYPNLDSIKGAYLYSRYNKIRAAYSGNYATDTNYVYQYNCYYVFGINVSTYNPVTIIARPDNATHGYVLGGGPYSVGDTVTLEAHNLPGYTFSRWNDNNRNATRTFIIQPNTHYPEFVAIYNARTPYTLSVVSSNAQYGTTYGSGTYYAGDTVMAIAIPADATKHFVRWNDNNSTNPRRFVINNNTQLVATFAQGNNIIVHDTIHDTSYINTTVHDTVYINITIHDTIHDTAFINMPQHNFNITSDNAQQGVTVGTGTYPEGLRIGIAAVPNEGYRFSHWSDGNTDNPRHFTVSGPVTLTAFFTASAGTALPNKNVAVEVYPNPTTGFITLSQYAEKVEVLDNVGRLVAVAEGVINMDLSDLTDGTYTLRISTNDCVVIKKIVKR